ncbi:MAG TPA: hypothetical protein VKW04_06280 [Planctomycetota bacterium]|nr:hypothetical protein [Planctomycetota bacterium]
MARWAWVLSAALNLGLLALTSVPEAEGGDPFEEPDFRCAVRDAPPDLPLWREAREQRLWPPLSERRDVDFGDVPGDEPPRYRAIYYLDAEGRCCRTCLRGLEDFCGGEVRIVGRPYR